MPAQSQSRGKTPSRVKSGSLSPDMLLCSSPHINLLKPKSQLISNIIFFLSSLALSQRRDGLVAMPLNFSLPTLSSPDSYLRGVINRAWLTLAASVIYLLCKPWVLQCICCCYTLGWVHFQALFDQVLQLLVAFTPVHVFEWDGASAVFVVTHSCWLVRSGQLVEHHAKAKHVDCLIHSALA